ncbi:MAG: hypothetical protein HGA78_08860, partial [Nitrospirales bacterium]|nr:hypothetical protein [Nitrospirales bacterium]
TVSASEISHSWRGGIKVSYASPTITGCTITDSEGTGIELVGSNAVISNNRITNNKSYGMNIDSNSVPTVTGNKIVNNTEYGLYYSGTTTLTATNNNWGASSGPLDDSDDRATGGLYNPNGKGSKVSDHVNYYPWTGAAEGTETPTGFTGAPGNAFVTLSWNANTEASLGGYKIYYGTSPGLYTTPKIVGKITSYKLTGLSNDMPYYIAISSMNKVGDESDRTAEITLTPEYDVTKPVSTIIAPTNGSVLSTDNYIIKGTATDGEGTGVRRVEISINNGPWTSVTGKEAWSYAWTAMAPGSYTIKARAVDNADNMGATKSVAVTVALRTPSEVAVDGRQLRLNGEPFTIRGIGYAPTPIGTDPETTAPFGDYFTAKWSGIHDRDLPLLRQMGANTVRLWGWENTADHHAFLDKAFNNGVDPVYVIAGFSIKPGRNIDPADPANERAAIKEEFRQMVATHKNHPAILLWAVGNGLNTNKMYGKTPGHLFSLINEMAEVAHLEEGAGRHPVTTALADTNLISTIAAYDAAILSLDVWSANVYRGKNFGTLFNDYSAVSSKPLAILEYGIDAYDSVNNNEYENLGTAQQAVYAAALWKRIYAASEVCIGGTLTEYSDEWWKGKNATDPQCQEPDPTLHGLCGNAASVHPDKYANAEWWGVMRTKNNGKNLDIMEPRDAYLALKGLWVVKDPVQPSATATSSTGIVMSWKDSSDNETGFVVERKNGGCGSINAWAEIVRKPANTASFTDTGLRSGAAYAYRVKAYTDGSESAWSACVSAKTGATDTPAAPQGFKAVSASASKINLVWADKAADETSFGLYRRTGAGAWSLLTTTAADATSFSDQTATGNDGTSNYSYYLKACNAEGCSPATQIAIVPFRPMNLAASTGSSIGLTWSDKSSNESGFEVYRKEGDCTSGGTWSLLKRIAANSASYTDADTALVHGGRYSYRLRAFFETAVPVSSGFSLFSNCVSATAP